MPAAEAIEALGGALDLAEPRPPTEVERRGGRGLGSLAGRSGGRSLVSDGRASGSRHRDRRGCPRRYRRRPGDPDRFARVLLGCAALRVRHGSLPPPACGGGWPWPCHGSGWGRRAIAAVLEADELVRRGSLLVLDHLGGAAAARPARRRLELAQVHGPATAAPVGPLRDEHTPGPSRCPRGRAWTPAGSAAAATGRRHVAALSALSRRIGRLPTELRRRRTVPGALLAALDDPPPASRSIAPDAATVRSRLAVGLPITAGPCRSADGRQRRVGGAG